MTDGPSDERPPRLSFDCPASLLGRLRARYAEPHRRYHTWEHVLACLDACALITGDALPEIDLALLFHDAVYEPLARDNEARSAELLVEEGRRAGLDERLLQRALVLVEATQHGREERDESEEARIVVDADLSILGADRATFELYERRVREEYAQVDDAAYAAGRTRVLRGFLAQPTIFATRRAQRMWEEPARRNLESSLEKLARDVRA